MEVRREDITTWIRVKYRISLALDFIAYFVRTFHNIIMAIVVRILFFSTGTYICFINVSMQEVDFQISQTFMMEFEDQQFVQKMENFRYSLAYLFIPHALMIVETIYVLLRKCGEEYHWICLSVFLYLCTSVPSIIILQNFKNAKINASFIANETETVEIVDVVEPWKDFLEDFAETSKNNDVTNYFTNSGGDVDAYAYIQLLLVVLLFGRWMLPRGKITREQLSALLISYLSMCADMLDFISVLNEPSINTNDYSRHAIQALWVISLFQFTLVKSNVGGPRQRRDWVGEMEKNGFLIDVRPDDDEEEFIRKIMLNKFTETDLWGVLFTMLFQDLPFLVMRLIIIFYFKFTNETIYFFVVKNSVLVMMDVYRSLVICMSPNEETDQASLERLVPVLHSEASTQATKRDTMSTSCSANGDSGLSDGGGGGGKELRKKKKGASMLVGSKSWAGPNSLIAPERDLVCEEARKTLSEVCVLGAPMAMNETDNVSDIL